MARKKNRRRAAPAPTGMGALLTARRTSNAAGRHATGTPRQRDRAAQRRAAIADASK